MGQLQTSRKCRVCNRRTLHERRSFGTGMGLLLSVLTLGAFVPLWMGIKVYEAVAIPWRCQVCGRGRVT
jgi:hypothetical protein